GRLSSLRALEVEKLVWPASDLSRVAGLDPAHEPREHALGGSAYSWRVAQHWPVYFAAMRTHGRSTVWYGVVLRPTRTTPMRRREVITLLGGVAATWPIAAWAQHAMMAVVGFLSSRAASEV